MATALVFDGLTVFVGGPFSAALIMRDRQIVGFDEHLRARFTSLHHFFTERGARIFSSHLAENYGQDVHEQTLVQRDNSWLRASDFYIAFLPMRNNVPYRTDGTFVEIGLALGAGKLCALLIDAPEDTSWSYYVRNLGRETGVVVIDASTPELVWETVLVALAKRLALGAVHIGDATVLQSLLTGAPNGHFVRVADRVLAVPTGVTSSRFDNSLALAGGMIRSSVTEGSRVAAIGAQSLELAAHALAAGASELTLFEVDQALGVAVLDALRSYAHPGAVVGIIDPTSTEHASRGFDAVAVTLPLSNAQAPSPRARYLEWLDAAIAHSAALLPPTTKPTVFVTAAVAHPLEDVHRALSRTGLVVHEEHLCDWTGHERDYFGVWKAGAG